MATLFSGDASSPTSQGRNEDDGRARRHWFAVWRGESDAAAAFDGTGQWLSMARDDTYRATDVRDFPVRCREGTLWVTSPEVPRDTVVAAGEHLSVTSRGTLLVVALAPSSMWIPQGFAVGDVQGTSKLRMGLRRLRNLATLQHLTARTNDGSRGATSEAMRPALFQKFMIFMGRVLVVSNDAAKARGPLLDGAFLRVVAAFARRRSSGAADARERYLSRSVDHADFENRLRSWGAHEERLRRLPPVL